MAAATRKGHGPSPGGQGIFAPLRAAQTNFRNFRKRSAVLHVNAASDHPLTQPLPKGERSMKEMSMRRGAEGFRPFRPFRTRSIFHPRGARPLNRQHNARSRRRASLTARPRRTASAKSGRVEIQL